MVVDRPQPPVPIEPLRERKVEPLHEQAHDHAHLHARELSPDAVRGPVRERDERGPVKDVPRRRAAIRRGEPARGEERVGRGGEEARVAVEDVGRDVDLCPGRHVSARGHAGVSGEAGERTAPVSRDTHRSAMVAPCEWYGTWRGPLVGSGGASLRVSFLHLVNDV